MEDTFDHVIQVPSERIGIIIGSKGEAKNKISKKCNVGINIQSNSGKITIVSQNNEEGFLKAIEIIQAIAHGFSPENAFRLLKEETNLQMIDIRDYVSRSPNSISRIKGRIIGENGKTRKTIEEITGSTVSIYGSTIAMIGSYEETKLAFDAFILLLKGRSHKSAYEMLYEAKRKLKLERLQLWESS